MYDKNMIAELIRLAWMIPLVAMRIIIMKYLHILDSQIRHSCEN